MSQSFRPNLATAGALCNHTRGQGTGVSSPSPLTTTCSRAPDLYETLNLFLPAISLHQLRLCRCNTDSCNSPGQPKSWDLSSKPAPRSLSASPRRRKYKSACRKTVEVWICFQSLRLSSRQPLFPVKNQSTTPARVPAHSRSGYGLESVSWIICFTLLRSMPAGASEFGRQEILRVSTFPPNCVPEPQQHDDCLV